MDALIAAAGRALARGDVLQALQHVALRDDPPALALRGIALARLGELARARDLLREAGRRFAPGEGLARARCAVAEAEIALALRELDAPVTALATAIATLDTLRDPLNAAHGRLIAARRAVLLGHLDDAASQLAALPAAVLPPAAEALAALVAHELALRRLAVDAAEAAWQRAERAAQRSGLAALQAEVRAARRALEEPAARRRGAGGVETLRLHEVASLQGDAGVLLVDGCRHAVGAGELRRDLARRPVLYTLLRTLAEGWPGDVDRLTLIARAFRTREPDDSHRARLRVELGRLRTQLHGLADVAATPRGYALRPAAGRTVAVLLPPLDGDEAALQALLADGAAWSSAALALALDCSQRQVQRALAALQATGRVRAIGHTRSRRWLAPTRAAVSAVLLLPTVPGPG